MAQGNRETPNLGGRKEGKKVGDIKGIALWKKLPFVAGTPLSNEKKEKKIQGKIHLLGIT